MNVGKVTNRNAVTMTVPGNAGDEFEDIDGLIMVSVDFKRRMPNSFDVHFLRRCIRLIFLWEAYLLL